MDSASNKVGVVDELDLNDLDRRMINRLQRGFPVCPHPFRVAAQQLGTDEDTLMRRVQTLLDDGVLTRFGPLFHAEKLGGALSLCALEVPPGRFDEVCEIVNGFDEVAHNYERDHQLNMWFVLATDSEESKAAALQNIESSTGLSVFDLPKEREFFVGLHFEV